MVAREPHLDSQAQRPASAAETAMTGPKDVVTASDAETNTSRQLEGRYFVLHNFGAERFEIDVPAELVEVGHARVGVAYSWKSSPRSPPPQGIRTTAMAHLSLASSLFGVGHGARWGGRGPGGAVEFFQDSVASAGARTLAQKVTLLTGVLDAGGTRDNSPADSIPGGTRGRNRIERCSFAPRQHCCFSGVGG